MGASSDKAQQNQAANQQIQGNTQAAQAALANYLANNPSILAQAPKSIAGPQQFSGVQGGGNFGPPVGGPSAPQGNMPRVQPQQPPQQVPQAQPRPQLPPGLLGLLGGPK